MRWQNPLGVPMKCENCGNDFFEILFGSGRFCCKRCARQYSSKQNREKTNKKISESLKNFCKDHVQKIDQRKKNLREEYYKNPNRCTICSKIISFERKRCKTCGSKECSYFNCGGVREHSGTGKSGYYKGIFCSSAYELVFLIYCLDNNIKIQRCKKHFEYLGEDNKIHNYYPDFEIEDENGTVIIEIKGYYQDTVLKKREEMERQGIRYKILFKKDLEKCFNYVSEKYPKDLASLYDKSRYKNSYECSFCGKRFEVTYKKETEVVYCCRSCAMKGNRVKCKKFKD
jgi:predicted nuclease of restriction endonuclease-like RecB superfamily